MLTFHRVFYFKNRNESLKIGKQFSLFRYQREEFLKKSISQEVQEKSLISRNFNIIERFERPNKNERKLGQRRWTLVQEDKNDINDKMIEQQSKW